MTNRLVLLVMHLEIEMEIKDKHLTIVYTINDREAFEPELMRLMKDFKKSDGEPWAITAWARDHELHRLSLIEEAVDAREFDLVEEIIGMVNVGDMEDIDAVRARLGILAA